MDQETQQEIEWLNQVVGEFASEMKAHLLNHPSIKTNIIINVHLLLILLSTI